MNHLPTFMIAFCGIMLFTAILSNRDNQPVKVFCQQPELSCKSECKLPAEAPSGYVRVRVAVGINEHGDWAAGGGIGMNRWEASDEVLVKGDALRWLVADIPVASVPEEITTTVEVE